MRRRTILSPIAFVLSILLLLTSCGTRDTAPSPVEADVSSAQEPITLSWYIHYNWYSTPWGGNLVSDTITEETGVTVEFVAPSGNEREKLAALIASDDLPDLITIGWWEPQVQELIDKGYVLALNTLADEYCPDFYEQADATALRWYTQADGNVYCYPNSSYSPQDLEDNTTLASNQTFLVRKDIYEAIGSPDMTTPEGFANAVRAAAEQFPVVDGQPLIPIGAHAFSSTGCDSFDKFLQNFLAVPYEKDGSFYDRYTDPDYLQWLKMFRQLGEEGYLADDIFVDQRAQMEEKIRDGRYFCMIYQRTDIAGPQRQRYQIDPDSIYIAVDGPRNAAGDAHTLPSGGVPGWTVTLISQKCSHPERAILFMTYLMSERGQRLISVGVEGESYTMRDGKAVFTPEVEQLYQNDYDAFVRQIGADDTYWMLQNNVMQSSWVEEADPSLSQMADWAIPYTVYTAQYDRALPAGSEEAVAEEKIDTLWGKTLPQLLLASTETEFDAILDDFVQQRSELGYDSVLAAKTEQVELAKELLELS